MVTAHNALVSLNRPDQIKSLLGSSGPCLSVYFPLNRQTLNPNDEGRRWKRVVRQLGESTARLGEKGRELVHSLTDWPSLNEGRTGKEKALVVFRSPEHFNRMWIRVETHERIAVGPEFLIRPLLPLLANPVFGILAVSQNDTRLLRCTLDSSEEIPLAGAESNFERYMNSAKPDHIRDNRAAAGPGGGSTRGITFGTASNAEDHDEYLANFFRQIDRSLTASLRETCEPVILVAVEHELSLYRSVSAYSHLLDEGIQGAPNGLKGGEMHARALAVLDRHRQKVLQGVLAEYNHLAGGGRATNRLKEVVTAAHDGRVNKLIVPDSMEQAGSMDEVTRRVKAKEGDGEEYDLLNSAAVQTLLHGGHVFVAPNNKMPNGSPLAAIFRY
jgi:Bacterial archaeo-eukaryotic release factor family 3